MKLSNKILLGFFGFIFLYLNAAFMEIRLTGSPNIINDENSVAERIDLPGINYLVLNGVNKEVNVIGSDQSSLEVRSISGDLLKNVKYVVSGDTLTLTGIDAGDIETFKITVFVPSTNFKTINVNSAEAHIKGLHTQLLNIYQKKGRVYMSDCHIERVELELEAAYLNIAETSVDTLYFALEKSTLNIYSPLIRLQGSLHNQSFLEHLSNVEEIQLKKDESSKLSVYVYH
jgi:hypothetical protein